MSSRKHVKFTKYPRKMKKKRRIRHTTGMTGRHKGIKAKFYSEFDAEREKNETKT